MTNIVAQKMTYAIRRERLRLLSMPLPGLPQFALRMPAKLFLVDR
jgi:hypothetical protein